MALLQFTEATTMFNALNFNLDMMGGGTRRVRQLDGDLLESRRAHLSVGEPERGEYPIRATGTIFYGRTNYMGNYGGPGVISLMSGTIIPANNWMIGTATNLATAESRQQPLPGCDLGTRQDRRDHRRHLEYRSDQRAVDRDRRVVSGQTIVAAGGNAERGARSTARPAPPRARGGRGSTGDVSVVRRRAGDHGHPLLRQRRGVGRDLSRIGWSGSRTITSAHPTRSTAPTAQDPTDGNSLWPGYYVTAIGSAPPSSLHPGGVNVAFLRRLGPLHQEHGGPEYLVGPGQPQSGRGHQLGSVLRDARHAVRPRPRDREAGLHFANPREYHMQI